MNARPGPLDAGRTHARLQRELSVQRTARSDATAAARGVAALLFDLDGTLVDSDPLHFRAWQQTFADHGRAIDEHYYKEHVSGGFNPVIVREQFPPMTPVQVESVVAAKEQHFRALAADLEAVRGLPAVLGWAHRNALKTAVVTNAPAENVRFLLSRLGLADAFTTVVLAEDVPAAKPDPAPYLAALSRLDVPAAAALAFEDSPSGIQSALAAGVPVVGISSTRDALQLHAAGALMTVVDFQDQDLWSYLASLTIAPR
jgi:HAD superfamily hydrolase (TIGR01509 family)